MRTIALWCSLVLMPALASAQAVTWKIDPGHSEAAFTVKHLLIANVRGEFDGPTGTVVYDPKDITGTIKVEAVFQTKTVNSRNSDRDNDLKSAKLLDVAHYPTMTFKSTKAQAIAPGHFTLVGNLTIHGVTKEVSLDVQGPTQTLKDWNGEQRVGASATTTINRHDFGLQYNELVEGAAIVGDEVHITIDLEASHP